MRRCGQPRQPHLGAGGGAMPRPPRCYLPTPAASAALIRRWFQAGVDAGADADADARRRKPTPSAPAPRAAAGGWQRWSGDCWMMLRLRSQAHGTNKLRTGQVLLPPRLQRPKRRAAPPFPRPCPPRPARTATRSARAGWPGWSGSGRARWSASPWVSCPPWETR
jgi:hypothetical protein